MGIIRKKDNQNISKITFFFLIVAIITGCIIAIFSPFYGFAILGFFVFISLTIYNISYGIIFWILTGGIFVIPIYSVRNAGIYPSALMLSALILLWLFISVEKKTFGIVRSKLLWPLVFIIVTTCLSAIKGNILYDPDVSGVHRFILVQIFASFIIIISVVTAFLIPRFFKTAEEIRIIYLTLICVGAEVFVYEVFELGRFGFRPSWDLILQAHAISLAYAGLLFIPELSIFKKIGFVILMIFSIGTIAWQFFSGEGIQWISGWIAICIPLVYITFQKSKKWSVFLIVLISVLIFTLAIKQIENTFATAAQKRDFDRLIMWETSVKLWKNNPFFGLGSGNYMDYAMAYADPRFAYTSAHSQYFQILTELGGLGLIFFIWPIIKILFMGRQLIKIVKDNYLKAFTIGIMGSIYGQLFACFIGDYIFPSYHNGGIRNLCTTIYFWILVGSLMAIEQISNKNLNAVKNV